MNTGRVNPSQTLEATGITGLKAAYYNLQEPALIQHAITRGEGELGNGGAFLVSTGKYTGRSPKDKFVVNEPSVQDTIWWENNPPMEIDAFNQLKADMLAHMAGGEYYVQDLYGGADPASRLNVRVVTELAWHNLFIRTMLRRPEPAELDTFVPGFTVINCPSFNSDPTKHGCRSDVVIAISMEQKTILIAGTEYAGENKKSVFSILNYLLPEQGIMPMHCSANHAIGDPSDTAVFFGLSGTGKTNLSAEAEPEIHATTSKFGTVIENMVYDPFTKELDFDDDSIAANMRCAYPLEYISNASETAIGGQPNNIIMLTCDAFGVLPPIARLTPEQAMYHFLSGFTSKVAGTERGVTEPQPTFSTCFGAPFMPRRPEVYGALLRDKIAANGATCWLVNTGWTGGAYGTGSRMPIKATRALLTAALNGSLNEGEFRKDTNFGFEVPTALTGVDSGLLDPRSTWGDKAAYDAAASKLVGMFTDNFAKYEDFVGPEVLAQAIKVG